MVVLRLPDSWSNWNLEVLAFEERGKPEYPGEKPLAIWIYSPGPWSAPLLHKPACSSLHGPRKYI